MVLDEVTDREVLNELHCRLEADRSAINWETSQPQPLGLIAYIAAVALAFCSGLAAGWLWL